MKIRTLLIASASALIAGVLVAQGQVPGVNSTVQSVFNLVYEASTSKPTYSATQVLTPASSATDICTLTGSSTKTVRVRRVIFTGLTTSTVATNPISVLKRSTANSSGTAVTPTVVPYSSTSSAASAVARGYTANPTTGTLVGYISDRQYTFNLTTTGAQPNTMEFKYGELGSPVFLRGTSQVLAVNLGAATVAGPISCTFEWTEDNDS